MKSRAELLAEIEENRLENKEIKPELDLLSIAEPDAGDGYNPYDHPGRGKELPDGADIMERRREMLRRRRKRLQGEGWRDRGIKRPLHGRPHAQ